MHEIAITQSILNIALTAAREQGASRIRVIRLDVGAFSGIVPECVEMYLNVLAEGTIAQAAKIEFRRMPVRISCCDCGQEGEITEKKLECPHCGSLRLKRLSGRECTVESLEVDS
ncbi:MAG: hydrogenase maturation nickel metallochaperone HypA [Oscillibacter sp.]